MSDDPLDKSGDSAMEADPSDKSAGPPMGALPGGGPRFSESGDFPVWSGRDLVGIVVVLFVALFLADSFALLIADAVSGVSRDNARALASDPRVAVPTQGAAYLATVGFIVRVIKRRHRSRFLQAVHWRFPAQWLKFLLGGMVLAILIQALSLKLPIPKQMPIDQYFQSTSGAWMMAGFGTLVAPFCEELFFRGLLFPVVLRRLGMFAGVVITGGLFALIHASQLAHAWAAMSMLFVVGVVLTIVRARAHSLAASVLVHTGYNLALFALLYVGTAGFHDFKRLGQ
jgi:membrane protease YdiL (CAAX protease family)